ncbi:hypothetical protein EON65_35120 [archaeon]|nr:MAG: hypothetical protein EON65_35120 [archaeon]
MLAAVCWASVKSVAAAEDDAIQQALEKGVQIDFSMFNKHNELNIEVITEDGYQMCNGKVSKTGSSQVMCNYGKEMLRHGNNTIFVKVTSTKTNEIVSQSTKQFYYEGTVDQKGMALFEHPWVFLGGAAVGTGSFLLYAFKNQASHPFMKPKPSFGNAYQPGPPYNPSKPVAKLQAKAQQIKPPAKSLASPVKPLPKPPTTTATQPARSFWGSFSATKAKSFSPSERTKDALLGAAALLGSAVVLLSGNKPTKPVPTSTLVALRGKVEEVNLQISGAQQQLQTNIKSKCSDVMQKLKLNDSEVTKKRAALSTALLLLQSAVLLAQKIILRRFEG